MKPRICPWWFAYTFDNPVRRLLHKPEKIFSPYLHNGMTAADIGCGLGYFSLGLAHMVGETGKVFAIDIQQEMLKRAEKRASKANVAKRIEFRQSTAENINLTVPVDFALAFWMVHEAVDVLSLFRQIREILNPAGLLFIAEPKFHVSTVHFNREIELALNAGFRLIEKPIIAFSHSSVFRSHKA